MTAHERKLDVEGILGRAVVGHEAGHGDGDLGGGAADREGGPEGGHGEGEDFVPFDSNTRPIKAATLQSLMTANPTMYDAIKAVGYQALLADGHIKEGEIQ